MRSQGARAADLPDPWPADAPVLAVEDAAYAVAGRPVLRGASLEVEAGEVRALLGPNGAGKTTLVRAVCGRLRLDRGTVRLDGLDPAVDRRARAMLGLVPQDIALHERLTGRENLEVFARLMGVRRSDVAPAVAASIRLTGLAGREHEVVARLSGGWRRRVNIAAGLLHGPRLLVLDEPTVGVDLEARTAIQDTLAALRDAGMAVLLVTHDFEQAASLADRVGILAEGRVVLDGRPAELVRRHFGTRRHASFAIGGEVGTIEAALLAREGLRAAADGTWTCGSWTGEAAGDYPAAAAVAARLEARGLTVAGVTVREPSLADLYGLAVGPS